MYNCSAVIVVIISHVCCGTQAAMRDVEIPRSIPRLTTPRVLTMSFVEGDPITRLKVFLYFGLYTSCKLHIRKIRLSPQHLLATGRQLHTPA